MLSHLHTAIEHRFFYFWSWGYFFSVGFYAWQKVNISFRNEYDERFDNLLVG
ncbi:MAG: hypothetical protein LLG02_14205 [Pelosinus sp.]|nr:hypothetical protein [Pelosinus sp.]